MTRVVKAKRLLVLVTCLAVVSGCFWRSYGGRMRTHTQLLVSFARKTGDLVAVKRFTAQNLPELTYPLERATTFAEETQRHASEAPDSLVAFEALLARYRELVLLADRTRQESDAEGAVPSAVAAVVTAADAVEAALVGEGR